VCKLENVSAKNNLLCAKHFDSGGDVQSVQTCARLQKLDLCKKVCRQMCATKVAGNTIHKWLRTDSQCGSVTLRPEAT
jgi:hypothetical protein